MNNRIKKVRKMLDLTQQDFGDKIGLKRNSVALIENGRNTSDQTIAAICREFNVNEEWLRTGVGEMFLPDAANELDALAKKYGLSASDTVLIEKYVNLKPEIRTAFTNFIVDAANALTQKHEAAASAEDVEAAYIKKTLNSVQSTDSTASSTTEGTEAKEA